MNDQLYDSSRARRMLALAIVYAAVVLFAGYGNLGLTEPDEGRYAEVAREMMERLTQDGTAWLYPTLDGEPYYNKPPLVFWLTVAGLKLFGINEWGARMPSALAAFGTVLMVVWLMRRWGGDRLAALAAIVLPTTAMFFLIGRLLTTDMLLTFFMTAALVAFAAWLESAKRRALVVFWLALAGGMMTKGPVGVVVPMLVAMATLLWLRQPRRITALGWAWGLPLFAVVALPWFLVVAAHFNLWSFFIGRETIDRFFTSIHKRNEPFWFFFAVLPVGLLPWTLLALLGAATAPPERLSQDWKLRRALLISWVLVPLVFFSASQSKLQTYILPACVPAALLVAHLWNTLLAEPKQMTGKRWTRVGLRVTWLFTALLPLTVWAWLAHDLEPGETLPPVVGICAAATTAVVLLAGAWAWRDPARWFAALAACLPLILVGADYTAANHEEALGSRASFRVIGAAVRKMAQKEDLVVLVTVHMEHYGLSFYANRLVTKRHYGDPPKGIQTSPATELGLAEPDMGHIWAWAMEGHRLFFVASHGKLDRLLKTAPVPLRQLLATRHFVLLSNR